MTTLRRRTEECNIQRRELMSLRRKASLPLQLKSSTRERTARSIGTEPNNGGAAAAHSVPSVGVRYNEQGCVFLIGMPINDGTIDCRPRANQPGHRPYDLVPVDRRSDSRIVPNLLD